MGSGRLLWILLCGLVLPWHGANSAHAAETTTMLTEHLGICNPLHVSTSLTHTTLSTAINSTSQPDCSGNKMLLFTPGTWVIGADLTIPDRMAIQVPQGSLISVSAGMTLTLDCRKIFAATYPVFTGTGTVTCSNTPFTVTFAASMTFAVDTSPIQAVTLTGNVTSITLSRAAALLARGSVLWLRFTQDATGGRTVTGWPGTVIWTSGSAPVLDTRANASTWVALLYDGSLWREIMTRLRLAQSERAVGWSVAPGCTSQVNPVPVAAGPSVANITCTDVSTACVYASLVAPPAGWAAFGGLLVRGEAIHTGTPAGEALGFDVSAQCLTDNSVLTNTWGTAVPLTIAFSVLNRLEIAQTAAITPTGTCAGGTLTAPLLVNIRACINPTNTICATSTACKLAGLTPLFFAP